MSESANPQGAHQLRVRLARDLLGRPERLFYLCQGTGTRRYVWSTQRQPCEFSVADAVGLAPLLKFHIKELLPASVHASADGGEKHHEVVGGGILVFGVMGGKHVLYEEFLATFGGEHLPD
ncbi:hypothetical protein [Comamonas sp. 17RB]|uniref:hypothetical protein n=1 Tax=Comamonas sp. 17RB TaxID=3047025 RepID=UPI0024B70708|nr:hypothetical protein [Comamonas sp. 17RB]MDI9855220.1 hypothetical protein [Comamonas sp. 17RB]